MREKFQGSNCFRTRLILSILSGKPIIIENIRIREEKPGLKSYESSFLDLIIKLTNGTCFNIDESGTTLSFDPGLLIGGTIEHDCGLERSVSYFLEALFCFAPFVKFPVEATLYGITNDKIDISVDALKHSAINLMTKTLSILEKNEIELNIISRGFRPNGKGSVFFKCPIRKYIKPINIIKVGKIKVIKGVAISCKVSPQISSRMIYKAKEILRDLTSNVYIISNHQSKGSASPGFGLSLYAETTNDVVYIGEAYSNHRKENSPDTLSSNTYEPSLPEDVAEQAVHDLLEDIYRGGVTTSSCQALLCLFMALGQFDVSKVEFGPFTPYTIQFLKHMQRMLKVTFRLELSNKKSNYDNLDLNMTPDRITATCIGIGFTNLSKTIT